MTIIYGIQATGVVTIAMEVLHNSCNICIHDLSDVYAYQANHECLCYNYYTCNMGMKDWDLPDG